jgi:hypothetical protein
LGTMLSATTGGLAGSVLRATGAVVVVSGVIGFSSLSIFKATSQKN